MSGEQLALDLFGDARRGADHEAECASWLESRGVPRDVARAACRRLFAAFPAPEAWARAKAVEHMRGRRAVPRLLACPLDLLGVFDAVLDYHTVWDRCWAARWVGLQEALEVRSWSYSGYRAPYTGAPVEVRYVDMRGVEHRRPYETESTPGGTPPPGDL